MALAPTQLRATAKPPIGLIPPSTQTDWHLTVGRTTVTIDGKTLNAPTVNHTVPGPMLRFKEGETISITVSNTLSEETSIHWHGLRVPACMDGVPGLSFHGIAPGESFTYRFPIKQNGTYWYHSHSNMQEAQGLIGPIIIDPATPEPNPCDRDYVIMLGEWTDVSPAEIVSNMKMQDDYYNFRQRSTASLPAQSQHDGGVIPALKSRLMWSGMNMSATDISDVSGVIYTYTMNAIAPDTGWEGLFRAGERIRLRFINSATMTLFDVRIPGLEMTVIAADGNPVEPVPIDEFRIGVAETYDVIVQPHENHAYTLFAQSEDRTGYALGTLTPQTGLRAPIPPMDPRPVRTMVDMGMDMRDMDMKNMPGMAMPDDKMTSDKMATMPSMAGMPQPDSTHHTMHSMTMPHMAMPGMAMEHSMNMANMPGMTQHGMSSMPGMQPGMSMGEPMGDIHKTSPQHHIMPGMTMPHAHHMMGGMNMQAMDMSHMSMADMPGTAMPKTSPPPSALEVDDPGPPPLNVENQNVATHPIDRLGDPGDGLSNTNRRVLTYTNLRALTPSPDPRPPSREIILHLTGNMERYIWGFNGRKFSESGPIRLRLNERVRFTLINDTMMEHPIHLHGFWSELENGHGAYNPRKHTIISQPGSTMSFLMTADEPGMWAFHCHLLYHMDLGMFRTVSVA
ncbi:copper resistance protein CopA [Neokomagataea tanensis NBRC 106556]|uniref:Copper resistance protein CopA n=2 Tax=Acetobacteraceae TaxID=433 RepID=A0ABQ0QGN8_9PROT|nr:copper resistance protein CopA [Neokomagataea tanensis NBRC 106556]